MEWMFTEPVNADAVEQSVTAVDLFAERGDADAAAPPAYAVRLHDIVVHNNKKWFDMLKGADVRLDAVVVHGDVLAGEPSASYTPATFRFPDVGDGDRLPTDALLVFYGRPRHFLDLSVIVSRDRGDSEDLTTMLADTAADERFQSAMAGLLGLAVAAPTAAAVMAGVGAAGVLGSLAYQLVAASTGASIGLYRGSKLEYPEEFGRGRVPADASFRNQHLSFWYDVTRAEA